MSFGIHFCNGRAVEHKVMMFSHELGCGMEEGNDCESKQHLEKKCCGNFLVDYQLTNDYKVSDLSIDDKIDYVLINELFSMDRLVKVDNFSIQMVNYSPPPEIQKDITILFQSFLC